MPGGKWWQPTAGWLTSVHRDQLHAQRSVTMGSLYLYLYWKCRRIYGGENCGWEGLGNIIWWNTIYGNKWGLDALLRKMFWKDCENLWMGETFWLFASLPSCTTNLSVWLRFSSAWESPYISVSFVATFFCHPIHVYRSKVHSWSKGMLMSCSSWTTHVRLYWVRKVINEWWTRTR